VAWDAQDSDSVAGSTASGSAVDSSLDCPICMQTYCDPLEMPCGHAFCRLCLAQSTHLAPSGRFCPMCRAPLDACDPETHPASAALEELVRKAVPREVYEARLHTARGRLGELRLQADKMLPVFFNHPGCEVGARVALHFFEPRYKILIRRAWEGSKLFVYCARPPRRGEAGVVVRVDAAKFLADGLVKVQGQGVRQITLGDTWVEDGTGGLFYTRAEHLGAADGEPMETALAPDVPRGSPGSSCSGCALM